MSRQAHGMRAWLVQRVTAVFIALFTVFLLLHFMVSPPVNAVAWQAWVSQPLISVGMALFGLSVLGHAWVGIRDVFMDYIKPVWLRLVLLVGLAGFLIACAIWLLRVLLLVVL